MILRKRKRIEGDVMAGAKRYLQTAENLGEIVYWRRINSGMARSGKYFIHLGRGGCSDLLIILKDGVCLWAEAKKSKKEDLRDTQLGFQAVIAGLKGHKYLVFTTAGEIEGYISNYNRCIGAQDRLEGKKTVTGELDTAKNINKAKTGV